MNVDEIVKEWFYRLPNGYADVPYTETELHVLEEVLNEYGTSLSEAKLEKEKFTDPAQMQNEVDIVDQAFLDAEPAEDDQSDELDEALIRLGGKQYQLKDSEIESLISYLEKDMGKTDFQPMSRKTKTASGRSPLKVSQRKLGIFADEEHWQDWLTSVQGIISEEKLNKLYFTLYDMTSQTYTANYIAEVLDELYNIEPKELQKHLFSINEIPLYGNGDGFKVPQSFRGIADINTDRGGSKGTETGRGEFVLPLLFTRCSLGGSNATHDVEIFGKGWHVKEIKTQNSYIRLGMTTFASSDLASLLQRHAGLGTKEFNVSRVTPYLTEPNSGKQSVIETLNNEFGGITTEQDALLKIQERLDIEMRKAGIGFDGGQGVIFYVASEQTLYFTPTNQCICGGGTVGAHAVGMSHSGRMSGPFAVEAAKR